MQVMILTHQQCAPHLLLTRLIQKSRTARHPHHGSQHFRIINQILSPFAAPQHSVAQLTGFVAKHKIVMVRHHSFFARRLPSEVFAQIDKLESLVHNLF